MKNTAIKIYCRGNAHLCQIAEAYLSFFVGNRIELYREVTDDGTVPDLLAQALMEDGMNVPRKAGSPNGMKDPDYLLSFGNSMDEVEKDELFPKAKRFHFTVEDIADIAQNEHQNPFVLPREAVKKSILKFIGKELIMSVSGKRLTADTHLGADSPLDPLSKKDHKKWKSRISELKQSFDKAKKNKKSAAKRYKSELKKLKAQLKPLKRGLQKAEEEYEQSRRDYKQIKKDWKFLQSLHPDTDPVPEAPGEVNDLKKIEGIGPKIERLLQQADIRTFSQLAGTKTGKLRKLLREAGPNYSLHDPSSWRDQARLATKGKWSKLRTLQDELKTSKNINK